MRPSVPDPARGDVIETNGAHELQFVVVMSTASADDQVEEVLDRLSAAGAHGRVAPGRDSTVIGAIGDGSLLTRTTLDGIAGVDRILPVSKPYKLV
jgi:3-deoxy-7-phosphoheptulonate synthase